MIRKAIFIIALVTISTAASAFVLRVPEPAVAPSDIQLPAVVTPVAAPAAAESRLEPMAEPAATVSVMRAAPVRCSGRVQATWRRSAYRLS